jgi:hypothetical protein
LFLYKIKSESNVIIDEIRYNANFYTDFINIKIFLIIFHCLFIKNIYNQ